VIIIQWDRIHDDPPYVTFIMLSLCALLLSLCIAINYVVV
jgi:hypothetical protein